MQYFKHAIRNVKVATWLTAVLISLVFLLLLSYFLDWEVMKRELHRIDWSLLILAFIVLSFEGLFTALRIQLFTPGNQNILDCLKLTAWFVIMLVVLPIRSGEIFVLFLYKQILKQKMGVSIMNIIAQRMLDILVLSGVFLVVLIANVGDFGEEVYEITFGLTLLLILLIFSFNRILEFISKFIFRLYAYHKTSVFKKILRVLLQARIWYQHYMGKDRIYKAINLTIIKWTCNLLGLILVFYSLNLSVNFIESIFLSASYNFMGIIPLQGVGGIGFSEVGLTGLLVMFDIPVDVAASSSIFMRVVAIVNPFIFFFAVMMLLLLNERFRKTRR